MTLRDFVAGELIDIIEWLDESRDTMVWRFPRPNNEIKNGAQLIVRPGQAALLVDQGKVADEFGPGRHVLATSNLPVLSRLRGWKYGFASPFKAEVVFVNTTQFTNRKWGTSNPVIVRDAQLGPVRLRAFGTFSVRIENPHTFVDEIVGTNALFTVDLIGEQLRDFVVSKVSGALAESQVSIFDLAARYGELGASIQQRVAPDFAQYGLEISQLVVENVSLPAEVEAAIDQRAKLGVIGNLDQYAKLQSADAVRDAAKNPGSGMGAVVGLGLGSAAVAQTQAQPPAVNLEPPPVPHGDAWYYVVNGERRGPTDLAGLKRAAASGELGADTLVWKAGMAGWEAVRNVDDLRQVVATEGTRG
ncbi:MAG TPA: SPFH domain-containing protein [Gemmatimonadaceae bacterium]|nr:SPFH domain-containing protein [Gemmatimonadaceae bacterium]